MEDVPVEKDASVVIQCVEDLIDFLGQAYVSVRASSAVSEQVCEDLREGLRFLQQLRIVEIAQDINRTDKAGASVGPALQSLRSAQSSLDALLSDARATKASISKKAFAGSSHARSLPAPSAAQPRVAPGLPGKGVHAAGPRPPHALSLAAQRPAGQAGQRAPVPGPAAPGGPRPGRPLPLAPAGAKALPKGASVGTGAAPPAPPGSGSLRSNRDSLELTNNGETPENRPGKGSTPGVLDGALDGAKGGAVQRGSAVRQNLGSGNADIGGASSEVRFPAFEALRLPTSFRRALSRFHTRVAEKAGEGSLGGQKLTGARIGSGAPFSGPPLTEPLAAIRHASESRHADPQSTGRSAGESARGGFLKRLEQGIDTGCRPLVSTASIPRELAPEEVRNGAAEDAVFTLLRAQLELLASCEGEEIWQAVAPANSHVARHRNRCLRAVLSGLQAPNANESSTKIPSKQVLTSTSGGNPIRTGIGRGHEPYSESCYGRGGAGEACAPSSVHSWLPPICWTAVEITPEDLRQSAAEVDVVPATGGAVRAVTCSSAKHMAALAHLSHSIESTVLRCYLEAVLLAPLVQSSSDQSEITNSFLARCRLAHTLLCTEGRGSLSISHRDAVNGDSCHTQ